jgi:hypothetical protein
VKNIWLINSLFSDCGIIWINNGWVNELEVERSREKQQENDGRFERQSE